MQRESNLSHGMKWGLIIGIVYCILLYLRFSTGASNPVLFSAWAFIGYIIVLVLLLISGFQLRKKNGGFIELKEVFKVLFLSVLIFELFYAVFNFIYLKYIDPEFFQKLKDSTEVLLQKSKQSQSEIDKLLKNIDPDSGRKMTIFDVLKTYLFYISISGLCAFLFSLIIRKKQDPFHTDRDNFLQSQ